MPLMTLGSTALSDRVMDAGDRRFMASFVGLIFLQLWLRDLENTLRNNLRDRHFVR